MFCSQPIPPFKKDKRPQTAGNARIRNISPIQTSQTMPLIGTSMPVLSKMDSAKSQNTLFKGVQTKGLDEIKIKLRKLRLKKEEQLSLPGRNLFIPSRMGRYRI